ncbi:hypothetical protein SAMN04488693_1192 [Arthrobacter subterraneus]|uniref:Uncharacterized protein n=1 Tax=Arthrobacter subterraneus TaxID=335973 RepID=A0A1G8MNN5_9MICC|nr:hypothetical protein [Arthrobacter subterraneus]SDI69543.1 hypothetical protein SAMN04488693_1192 [Arthrobacter subterraneus]
MDLEDFVKKAKLWNRDPGPQMALLNRKLRAEKPETIVDLYEQMQRCSSDVYDRWYPRPEPRARFEEHLHAARATNAKRIGHDPAASTGPVAQTETFTYEIWLRNWSHYQVMTGNYPPADDHFEDPSRPSIFNYFEGFIGNGFPPAFKEAYEGISSTPWPHPTD